MGGFFGAVRHVDDGGALALQFVEHLHDVVACGFVQHRGRLVEYQQPRFHGEHAGDGGALLLAAAHAGRVAVPLVLQADGVQGVGYAFAEPLVRHGEVFRPEGHIVLQYGGDDLVFGFLEHRADAATGLAIGLGVRAAFRGVDRQAQKPYGAGIGGGQAADETGERGLSRTVRTGQADALAGHDGQVHAVERPMGTGVVAESHVMQFGQWRGRRVACHIRCAAPCGRRCGRHIERHR